MAKKRATFNIDESELELLREIAEERGTNITSALRQILSDVDDLREETIKNGKDLILEDGETRTRWKLPSFSSSKRG